MAIAAGMVAGLGFGSNSVAALITRGLAEMTRLALREGGRIETLMGLAGLGDLVLTCTGSLSRNRYVGQELGKGKALEEITAGYERDRRRRENDAGCKTAGRSRSELKCPSLTKSTRSCMKENRQATRLTN